MLSLSALRNMWKQAHAPLGCVRTSKGGGCTFGIYYGHSPQGSVQGVHYNLHMSVPYRFLTFLKEYFLRCFTFQVLGLFV